MATGNLNVASINDGQLGGFRNLIINGNFQVNQRGAALKTTTAAAYNYDRWYYSHSSDGKLYQGIENSSLVPNTALTVSWVSPTATCEYLFSNDSTANNGWDGSGTFVTVSNGGTITVPSGLTTEHLWIRFTDTTDTDYSELSQVQVEYGSTATAFEHRPYGVELALCQRYYYKWEAVNNYSHLCEVTFRSSIEGRGNICLPVEPRDITACTATVSSNSDFYLLGHAAAAGMTVAAAPTESSRNNVLIKVGVPSATVGYSSCLRANGTTNAAIELDFEL